jgi:hypothetical protein
MRQARLQATSRQVAVRNTPVYTLLAGGIVGFATLLAWSTQYYVDYEMSLLPWLTSRGWVLYRDMVDQHPPLLPWLLALLGAGDPGLPLRLVITGLGVLTLALTYAVATRLAGPLAGLAAVALAAIQANVFEGNHLWYDGVLGPVYLGVLLLLARAPAASGTSGPHPPAARVPVVIRAYGSEVVLGLLLGAGLLIKQQAVLAVPFVALALWHGARAGRRVGAFVSALALPLVVAGLIYAIQGAFAAAWYWVVAYSLTGNYVTTAALPAAPSETPVLAVLYAPALALLLAGIGTISPIRRAAFLIPHSPFPIPLAGLGLLIAATAPAWPRYGRFHFQAAVPLLAVAGGVALVGLIGQIRQPGRSGRLVAGLGLGLLGVSTLAALASAIQGVALNLRLGPVVAAYTAADSGLAPLRAWVDAHAPPAAPIIVYHVDNLIYRALDREPLRLWAPQYPWILQADDTDARWWAGVAQARPLVAVVSAGGWDTSPVAGPATGEGRLRYDYHEAQRFQLRIYPFVAPVGVVGLLRNDGPAR